MSSVLDTLTPLFELYVRLRERRQSSWKRLMQKLGEGWPCCCVRWAGSCALVKWAAGVAIVRTRKQIHAMQAWRLAMCEARRCCAELGGQRLVDLAEAVLKWRSWCRWERKQEARSYEGLEFREGGYIDLCTKLSTTEVHSQQCRALHLGAVAGEALVCRAELGGQRLVDPAEAVLKWRSWCRRERKQEARSYECLEFREGGYIDLCTELSTTEVHSQQCLTLQTPVVDTGPQLVLFQCLTLGCSGQRP
ncbi:hypothetical protein Taro_041361 [Colocasia esculenta]|uniref:Uncharacterized protein n=1 Tax=Colocasia esculenta TaxID=4460 RepID=A0A843WX29_COLES|nr:hypothetical protein [Colocasia esculenta]